MLKNVLFAAAGALLNWRAFNAAKGTENTAITLIRFQQVMAGFAFVVILARVGGHSLGFAMLADRAG
jgi:hypothetical protein